MVVVVVVVVSVVVLVAVGVVVPDGGGGAVVAVARGGRRGRAGLAQGCDARAEGDAFEHLVGNDDREEGQEESVARDDQGEADYWRGLVKV